MNTDVSLVKYDLDTEQKIAYVIGYTGKTPLRLLMVDLAKRIERRDECVLNYIVYLDTDGENTIYDINRDVHDLYHK